MLITERGVSMAQVSRGFGVHISSLSDWVQELRDD
jgi:transposase-like protein